MHYGDVEFGDQSRLDLKALWSLDVLEIDAAEGRRDPLDGLYEFVDVGSVNLDVEHIDVGERLEEQPLALHHRLARKRSYVAETEHRGAV